MTISFAVTTKPLLPPIDINACNVLFQGFFLCAPVMISASGWFHLTVINCIIKRSGNSIIVVNDVCLFVHSLLDSHVFFIRPRQETRFSLGDAAKCLSEICPTWSYSQCNTSISTAVFHGNKHCLRYVSAILLSLTVSNDFLSWKFLMFVSDTKMMWVILLGVISLFCKRVVINVPIWT